MATWPAVLGLRSPEQGVTCRSVRSTQRSADRHHAHDECADVPRDPVSRCRSTLCSAEDRHRDPTHGRRHAAESLFELGDDGEMGRWKIALDAAGTTIIVVDDEQLALIRAWAANGRR